MRKSEAIDRAGSGYKLAKLLGITPQAVYKWQGDRIPEGKLYRLRELKPAWFRKPRVKKPSPEFAGRSK